MSFLVDKVFAYIRRRLKTGETESDASDASDAEEDDVGPGIEVLYKSGTRKVLLEPGKTVLKLGAHISPSEAEALKVAAGAGIPVPTLHGVLRRNGAVGIRMDYVQGETLEKLWPSMSVDQKESAAHQLRHLIERMRELDPPPNCIGCCDGTGVRDTRVRFTYHGPVCHDEGEFNDYLDSTLFRQIPSLLRASFRGQLRTNHDVVFTHGDLTPRNILMQDGKISGILDWEESGWYPEYWEFVKFFERPADGDWREYADRIFPRLYHSELVTYTAMSKWRKG